MSNRQASGKWLEGGLDRSTHLLGSVLGTRRKSFVNILQEGLEQSSTLLDQPSHPQNQKALADMLERMSISDSQLAGLSNGGIGTMGNLLSGASHTTHVRLPSPDGINSGSFASVGASLSRNPIPEVMVVERSSCNRYLPSEAGIFLGQRNNAIGSSFQNGRSLRMAKLDEIAGSQSASFTKVRNASETSLLQFHLHKSSNSQLGFSSNMSAGHNRSLHQLIDDTSSSRFSNSSKVTDSEFETSALGYINFPRRTASSANLHSERKFLGPEYLERIEDCYFQSESVHNIDYSGYIHDGYSSKRQLKSALNGSAPICIEDKMIFKRMQFDFGNDINPALAEPAYVQYAHSNSDNAAWALAGAPEFCQMKASLGSSLHGRDELQKAYAEALHAQQKQQFDLQLAKSTAQNHQNLGNLKFGMRTPYTGVTRVTSGITPVRYGTPMLNEEGTAHFTSMVRTSAEAPMVQWFSTSRGNTEAKSGSSLLDEFKNKSKSFELSDILCRVVEFSSDHYGSRFIQQKLETATVEEKNKILPEIMPHARTLMTDVFGNYVVQQHGTKCQRKELASQLTGHVLPLSLQMDGCRVIQKALEVIEIDLQTQMVAELDGYVMKCVRDQNGNHVIQKCIECVPRDRIEFIISAFCGQVVALSMHPYGRRVIQRVLEYCDDPGIQIVMDEVMESVCTLAQDQYGNYVIQHVLEHGKSHERSAIIRKLTGQIVRMSQQKFASNVVEKCLTFGSSEERQLLIQEIIGPTDENEPLQAMMRDPFGNYVVQKVLETCDDKNLEFLLTRIRVHLDTLKRYTYGKHIVSRVEKLITAVAIAQNYRYYYVVKFYGLVSFYSEISNNEAYERHCRDKYKEKKKKLGEVYMYCGNWGLDA
ncbi:hypothetical protein SAY87_019318 [Trapa incisa]|uniref:PUM-HD domain-containing protein n=1 Tax=Trapa incisa TaxID=236973 RepID=A0AAN7K4P0_9MYRT|nr:hypothetical protein SAY87_019318 [Trapa incisa]